MTNLLTYINILAKQSVIEAIVVLARVIGSTCIRGRCCRVGVCSCCWEAHCGFLPGASRKSCQALTLVHDVAISKSSINQIIVDCGVSYKMLRRAAVECDDMARQVWMDEVRAHYVASQVVVLDETSKDERTVYRHYGGSPVRQQALISANFVRGDRYSMVAAMSIDGYIACHVVPGSVDGDEFFDFVVNEVVSFKLFVHHVLFLLTWIS